MSLEDEQEENDEHVQNVDLPKKMFDTDFLCFFCAEIGRAHV